MSNSLWITRSEGVLRRTEGKPRGSFDNSKFYDTFSDDLSPAGILMRSRFPSMTRVFIPNERDSLPDSWHKWKAHDVTKETMIPMVLDVPEVLSRAERKTVSRFILSQRYRKALDGAGMDIKPRGISIRSTPESPEDAVKAIIHSMFYIVDKNTTASLKSPGNPLGIMRVKRLRRIKEILGDPGENIIGIFLISSYSEPSIYMLNMFYSVASFMGVEKLERLLREIFEEAYSEHIDQIMAMEE